MGKKKDKAKKNRDPEKKAAQQAKKEAKQDKKAQKRLQKVQKQQQQQQQQSNHNHEEEDEDVDAILESFQRQTLELESTIIETLDQKKDEEEFPFPPRGNFTWTIDTNNNEIYMFGGEYYNGVENIVFDELLKWDPDAKKPSEEEKDNHNAVVKRGVWKRILTPTPRPAARCSHSMVYYNQALYVYGGEMATADQYHHYRDMWKFDMNKTNDTHHRWVEVVPITRKAPPPRSGHRALVWRHYMIVFGGFYEGNLREATRWYNDLWIYDFSTNMWSEQVYSKLASIPAPRSAFNLTLCLTTDTVYLYGGYSKLKNPAPGSRAEGRVHTDCWALHLKGYNTDGGKAPTWERLSKKGEYPNQRSGMSCTVYKNNKMLVYGGVQDEECDNHRMKSTFYDDLFAFDMDRRRWYTLRLKKKKSSNTSRRKKKNQSKDPQHQDKDEEEEDEEEEDDNNNHNENEYQSDIDDNDNGIDGEAQSNGWDLDKLRSNMFAFIDANGNIVYEKILEEDEEEEHERDNKSNVTKENNDKSALNGHSDDDDDDDDDDGYQADIGEPSLDKKEENNDKDIHQQQQSQKEVKFAASVTTEKKNTKIKSQSDEKVKVVSQSEVMKMDEKGLPQVVQREKPLPRINAQLVVKGNTLYIYGGLLEVGDREITLDDCWSLDLQKREEWTCIWPGTMHRQVWKGAESDNESYISTDQNDGDDDDYDENIHTLSEGEDDDEKMARRIAKKIAKKEKKRSIRDEIASLKEKLGLDNTDRTPQMGEVMADFYSRTSDYWGKQATLGVTATTDMKELKREGFQLARKRYEELEPVLERLNELDTMQREMLSSSSKKKSGSKKDKKKEKKDKTRERHK